MCSAPPPHARVDFERGECPLDFIADRMMHRNNASGTNPALAESLLKLNSVRLRKGAAVLASRCHPCATRFEPAVERGQPDGPVILAQFAIQGRDFGDSRTMKAEVAALTDPFDY